MNSSPIEILRSGLPIVGLEAFLDNGMIYFICVESVLENINHV
jgi:hypothetical protein